MISGCRLAISTLFNAFSIYIATYFNLHLQKFEKSHYLFEVNRRQTIFFEIKCYSCTNDAMLYSWLYPFLEYNLNLSIYRKTRKSFHFARILTKDFLRIFRTVKALYVLKHVIITFYLPHIFQYIPFKNVVNYFCF